MPQSSLSFGEYDIPDRNRLATRMIEDSATAHAIADGGIGMLGFLPIPGAGTASIIATMALQYPVYQSLARKMADVYESPYDSIARGIVLRGVVEGSAIDLGVALMDELGLDFLQEIGWETVAEGGIGYFASFVPFFGGFVSVGLDVAIAATMTWRVGTMISIYYQNGGAWVKSRRHTYDVAKGLTGDLSPTIKDRVDLNEVPTKVREVREYQIGELMQIVRELLYVAPKLDNSMIREILLRKEVRPELADEIIDRIRNEYPRFSPEWN